MGLLHDEKKHEVGKNFPLWHLSNPKRYTFCCILSHSDFHFAIFWEMFNNNVMSNPLLLGVGSYIIILDLEKKQLMKIMFPWIPTLIPRPRWEKNVSIKNSIKPYQRTLFSCNRAIRYYRYSGFSGSMGPVGDFLDCYTFTILYQCLAIAEQSDWLQRIDQLDPVGGFIQFKKGTKTAIK